MSSEKDRRETLNKSYTYLIPLLNEKCPILGEWFILLNNVYTYYDNEDEVICIKYEKYEDDKYLIYLETLKQNKLFKYCVNSEEYIIFVFKFPEAYLEEYNYFKAGKFSQFTDLAKNKILNYILGYHSMATLHNVRDVLYKKDSLKQTLEKKLNIQLDKDTELSSIPDKERETLIL